MKIKIIDLLNKIANNEEVPKKINFRGNIYEWEDGWYLTKEKNYKVCLGGKKEDLNILITAFNDDVEILEEPKKIEKINRNRYPGTDIDPLDDILDKLDELIDAVNELKRDK